MSYKQEELRPGIYCIENIENNKKYIGQTICLDGRWRNHKNELKNKAHFNLYLQASWNKYGEENFIFYILEECSIEELDEREIFWILEYKSKNRDFGYNLNDGGGGLRGYEFSEETRKKMSYAQSHRSEETLRKMSESRKGEKHPFYGKKFSEEHRKKISDGNKGRIKTPEERRQISERQKGVPKPYLKGRIVSDETKEKIRKSQKRKNINSSSKYYGVYFDKESGKWRTYLTIGKKKKWLNRHVFEIDAAKEYDEYVIKNNMDRPLNFPEDREQK